MLTLLDHETCSAMATRARNALLALLLLDAVATLADLSVAAPHRNALVGTGLVRLLVMSGLFAVAGRSSSERWIVVSSVCGVCVNIASAFLMGSWNGHSAVALMTASALSVAAAAYLPWGWRIQLLPVATALLAIATMFFDSGWSVISPHAMAQTLCCLASSMYFAVDHERIRHGLSRYNAHVAESCRQIGSINRELEHRVATREAMLESANARLESFCDSAATSLHPTLRSIGEHMDALRRLPMLDAPADSGRVLERIGNAAVRMRETLEVLLEYVALGRQPIRAVRVDLSREAEKRVQRLRELDPGRRIEVIVHDGMSATGDAVLLPEALRHLIDNAWKFTAGRHDAWIEIGTRATPEGARQFYVGDNGIGFDMAYAENLFRPFVRLQAVESLPGHGMGLARSARIVGRHAGRIHGEAAPGMGAEFRISLG